MTGSANIYGITEKNRRAEEQTLKVRSELSRIGCDPKNFKVNRQGVYLQMQYRYQAILADPYQVLIVLKKIPRELGEDEIWEQINKRVRQFQGQSLKMTRWAIGSMVSLTALICLILVLIRA